MKKEFYGSLLLLIIFITCTALYHESPRSFKEGDVRCDSSQVAAGVSQVAHVK